MLSLVIIFALGTALLEFALLMKWAPSWLLRKKWFAAAVHVLCFAGNIVIHFGTVVGTMTAIFAALVSFVTFPAAEALKPPFEICRRVARRYKCKVSRVVATMTFRKYGGRTLKTFWENYHAV